MKNHLLLLAFLALFISCNSTPEGYTISGTIIGEVADGTNVFLKKGGEGNNLVEVDTTQITGGKFNFTGVNAIPEMHYIFMESTMGYTALILENGEIGFEAQKDSLGFAKVKGTFQNDHLADYMDKSKKASEQAMHIQEDMESANTSRDTVLLNSLREEMDELRDEYTTFEMDYIKENPSALISALLIERSMMNKNPDFKELKALYDGLSPEIKETKAAQKLLKNLDSALERAKNAGNANVGAVAPNFSAPTPTGEMLALNDIKGKVTLIDFWAAWCRPCRAENPNVVNVYKKYHSKGLNIIGVSLDKTAEAWKKAIADDGLEWSHVSNIAYFDDAIAKLYNVNAIPAAFLLDENGVIVAKNLRGAALEAKVAELLQ